MTELINILSENKIVLTVGALVLAGLYLVYRRVKQKSESHPEFAEQAAKEANKAKWEAIDRGELELSPDGQVRKTGEANPMDKKAAKKAEQEALAKAKKEAKEQALREKEKAKQEALRLKQEAKLNTQRDKERAKAIKKGLVPPDFSVSQGEVPGAMPNALQSNVLQSPPMFVPQSPTNPQAPPNPNAPSFAPPFKPNIVSAPPLPPATQGQFGSEAMFADFVEENAQSEMGTPPPSWQHNAMGNTPNQQSLGVMPPPPMQPTQGTFPPPLPPQEPFGSQTLRGSSTFEPPLAPPPVPPLPPVNLAAPISEFSAPVASPPVTSPPVTSPPVTSPIDIEPLQQSPPLQQQEPSITVAAPIAPPVTVMASVPEETSSPEGSIQATGQAANQVASQVPHTFTKVRATELKAVPFGETDEQSGQEKVLLPQDKLDGQVVFPHPKPQVAASLAPTLDVVEVELPPEPKVKKDAVPPPLTPEELNSKLLRPAGPVIAGQTLMATPINIDQTQMHQSMKMSDNKPEKKTVTIQDLNVNYEKLTFMSPLEIVYYKLLRGALKQYLIFPRVSTSAVVKVNSAETEHKKIADNVLNSTNLSFIVCDVRLNIKAIVEVVDENEIPTNKDKARDYILKKAGCLLVRFYSGDKPPDVETLRLQIIGSL